MEHLHLYKGPHWAPLVWHGASLRFSGRNPCGPLYISGFVRMLIS